MNDSPESSSSAAHRAQDEDDTSSQQPGFLARMFGAPSQSETAEAPPREAEAHHPAGSAAHAAISVYNLRRMRLDDVAVPRAEITAVAVDTDLPDLFEVFRTSGYTRLPVYEGTMDTPVGLVHLKDIALTYGFNGGHETIALRTMLRPLLYAPPSMPIGVMLQKMQTDRTHMALVIDEYGGVDGLVTLEDLIEQVIGEIEDEHDVEEDKLWSEEAPGCWMARARASLEDFEQAVGVDLTEGLDDEEIDTLGGLVFVLTGRVPARGEVVVHPAGPEFEIVDADPRRVKRLRVRLPKEAAE